MADDQKNEEQLLFGEVQQFLQKAAFCNGARRVFGSLEHCLLDHDPKIANPIMGELKAKLESHFPILLEKAEHGEWDCSLKEESPKRTRRKSLSSAQRQRRTVRRARKYP